MVDTPRTVAELEAILADNTSGAISAQDLRDFVATIYDTEVAFAEYNGSGLEPGFDTIPWDTFYDRDVAEVGSLPSEIGLSYAIDGPWGPRLVATEDGLWAFFVDLDADFGADKYKVYTLHADTSWGQNFTVIGLNDTGITSVIPNIHAVVPLKAGQFVYLTGADTATSGDLTYAALVINRLDKRTW